MTSSLHALLAGLVDYAGLFPPAALDMSQAVRKFAKFQQDEHAWMLGRFIVPAATLEEFAAACADLPAYSEIRVSVLGETADHHRVVRFREQHDADGLRVDAIEIKADSPEAVRANVLSLPGDLDVYFEVAPPQVQSILPVLTETGTRAKIRTGGVTPEQIPSLESVFEFLQEARRARVAFKATAGLHHPLRSEHPLTYEPGCASATMHGFINLFVAAAVLHSGADAGSAHAILAEEEPEAFHWTEDSVHWRGRVTLSTQQIAAARKGFALSFGSCSFEEPVRDLQALGWLA